MKRRGNLTEKRDLLRDTIFCNPELFFAQIGDVKTTRVGCDDGNSNQIGVDLESLDILRLFRLARFLVYLFSLSHA